jgi:2,4-dienoyl-CoA reductase-like NADH-dependent reductase (Old Yellow Enzyme family)
VVRTAHGTNLGLGTISDDLIEYHYARGRGGVGLSIIEILSIHTTTPFTLNIFSPDLDKKYGKMVERIRPTDARHSYLPASYISSRRKQFSA